MRTPYGLRLATLISTTLWIAESGLFQPVSTRIHRRNINRSAAAVIAQNLTRFTSVQDSIYVFTAVLVTRREE